MAQHDTQSTTKVSTAQHSTAQHRTAQHSTAQLTGRVAAKADSTTCSVGANSSWKTAASWKKSEQKRYSEVAVSMSSLFTLRNSSCRPNTPCQQPASQGKATYDMTLQTQGQLGIQMQRYGWHAAHHACITGSFRWCPTHHVKHGSVSRCENSEKHVYASILAFTCLALRYAQSCHRLTSKSISP